MRNNSEVEELKTIQNKTKQNFPKLTSAPLKNTMKNQQILKPLRLNLK